MKFQSRYPFLTIAVVLMVSSVLGINHTVSAWGGGGKQERKAPPSHGGLGLEGSPKRKSSNTVSREDSFCKDILNTVRKPCVVTHKWWSAQECWQESEPA